MCGRYTIAQGGRFTIFVDGVARSSREFSGDSPPRYNVAPGQRAPVLRVEDGEIRQVELRWGLIPSWAGDPKIAWQCVNARSETIATKPAFRGAFKKRRCLIPADGFYEWQKTPAGKQPWRFTRPDDDVFLFAGLWETWNPPEGGPPLETFTVCTTTPNRVTAPIHDRMPVILDGDAARVWMDPGASPEALAGVMRPAPADFLTRYPVSTLVNSARNDSPECIRAITLADDGLT